MGLAGGGRRWLWIGAVALLGGALAWSNPGEEEFEAFAGERLADLVSEELCSSGGLPLLAQLVLQNCSELIHSQQAVLGRLAGSSSRRYNAGLFSLYATELGGQTLLPGLQLPRYHAVTLAGAGQLVLLQTGSTSSDTSTRANP